MKGVSIAAWYSEVWQTELKENLTTQLHISLEDKNLDSFATLTFSCLYECNR